MIPKNDRQLAVYEWELIHSYIGNESPDLAETHLKKFLVKKSGYKTKEAQQLLNDFQSFWR